MKKDELLAENTMLKEKIKKPFTMDYLVYYCATCQHPFLVPKARIETRITKKTSTYCYNGHNNQILSPNPS